MKIGNQVIVKKMTLQQKTELGYIDPESLHYMEKFEGKEGKLFDVTMTTSGFKNYHVEFGNNVVGIFYQNEIELVTT